MPLKYLDKIALSRHMEVDAYRQAKVRTWREKVCDSPAIAMEQKTEYQIEPVPNPGARCCMGMGVEGGVDSPPVTSTHTLHKQELPAGCP